VLKSIDILIGLVVVLLALSMAVTVITQSITTIINSRGRHLRRGLADLLQQLDPGLTAAISDAVATRLLTHPLVCGSNTPIAGDGSAEGPMASIRRLLGGRRLGNVVHREEFTKLLMILATDKGSAGLDTTAATALKTALQENGIADPEAALKGIRTLALRLERANPELSHVTRQNIAILQQAESDFVAKINSWFDQTMDRTSQRFTASTRAITFAGAFIVAFGLQVDTLALVNRLSADEKLRDALVDQAIEINKANPVSRQQNAETPAADDVDRYRSMLSNYGLITLPSADLQGWSGSLKKANYFGLLITALLLSLGAPFWYSALGSLLQLRSVLAVKDDAQRNARQSRDPAGTGATSAAPPASGGERGEMPAVG
jgi:hypothetical protein